MSSNRTAQVLRSRQWVSIPAEAGTSIASVDGRLWITHTGCGEDIVLAAGETWTVPARTEVIVQALGGAAVVAIGRSQTARALFALKRWIQALAARSVRLANFP